MKPGTLHPATATLTPAEVVPSNWQPPGPIVVAGDMPRPGCLKRGFVHPDRGDASGTCRVISAAAWSMTACMALSQPMPNSAARSVHLPRLGAFSRRGGEMPLTEGAAQACCTPKR
jgi:hypothetical protein